MARAAIPAEIPVPSGHRTLSSPTVFLLYMLVFLVLVGFLVAILYEQLVKSFMHNPGLNGLIVAVLVIGILYSFRQIGRLYREIRWVNDFRVADPGLESKRNPVLLAPMATMLRDRRGSVILSTASMASIMDSISSRLDEARDTSRYLIGLLVFLGLLGTFWGLLDTIQSVGKTIGALDTKATDSLVVFDELKRGLEGPLRGMGTAFSSSLLGLAGSLVLGFLDLQANKAQNRFYNELEEWLSGITELTPADSAAGGVSGQDLHYALYEMQRSLTALADRMQVASSQGGEEGGQDAVKDLAQGVNQLVRQMRTEQKVVREWVDEQASQQSELASVLRDLATNVSRRG